MAWSKYDVLIQGEQLSTAHRSFDLRDVNALSFKRDEQSNRMTALSLTVGAALLILAYNLISVDMLSFKAAVAAGLFGFLFCAWGVRNSERPNDCKYNLLGHESTGSKTLYSHSDERIVKEVEAALASELKLGKD